ncbi:hypothetical protein DVVG_00039 [Dunaliella viridis virus SI2]|uniref:hypothetical protein n=1 Tax=Dunaliella viridis virus SI2 TaxID=754069 RepID=UPI0002C0492F|nr:hypothetical protein DVVG_00039 [Dunaliella viridis virus SI2]AGH16025.1 hypothetical protein DVVG_00039 [Dunaliella viridis virus SI2]
MTEAPPHTLTSERMSREDRMQFERSIHDHALLIPQGYTRAGLAIGPSGPRLLLTGADLPALFWCPLCSTWERVLEQTDG